MKTQIHRNNYIFFCIVLLTLFSISVFKFPLYAMIYNGDFWEHSGTIKEWMTNIWNPQNPHLASDVGSPRYMPFYFLLTIMAKALQLHPITALGVGGLFSLIVLFWGIWVFFKNYFQSDYAPIIGIIVLFCCWGIGWSWSNLYQFRTMFRVITYPSTFVFAVSLLTLGLTIKIIRKDVISLSEYLIIGILSWLSFVCHPLTGAFALSSLCIMTLLEPNVTFRHRMQIIASVITGALAVEFWPYYSTWAVTLGTSSGTDTTWLNQDMTIQMVRAKKLYWNHVFYNPRQVMVTLGPALLGIPALIFFVYKKQHLFITAGCLVMGMPYLLNLFFRIPLGHRFLLFAIFYLHLAIVAAILYLQKKSILFSKYKLHIIFLSLCVLWNLILAGMNFSGYWLSPALKIHQNHFISVKKNLEPILSNIANDSIIMAPVKLSWPVPTFKGKVVSLFHPNPMVKDRTTRLADNRSFFKEKTEQSERIRIIKQYNITHIFYEKDNMNHETETQLKDLGSPAYFENYILIRIRNNL